MLTVIDGNIYESEILRRGKPTMLAYIRSDDDHRKEQLEVVDLVSEDYVEGLRVFVINENFINRYSRFQIMGAPTFIIFRGGNEKERMRGKTDRERLKAFVLYAIPDLLTSP